MRVSRTKSISLAFVYLTLHVGINKICFIGSFSDSSIKLSNLGMPISHKTLGLYPEFFESASYSLGIEHAISSFLADDFDMNKLGVQVMITGSQKALACPPGVSVIVLSDEAVKRVEARDVKCMYLNLKSALKNGERGQTPFTPAVGTLRQINARLKEIEAAGGVESETKKIAELAQDFRDKILGNWCRERLGDWTIAPKRK